MYVQCVFQTFVVVGQIAQNLYSISDVWTKNENENENEMFINTLQWCNKKKLMKMKTSTPATVIILFKKKILF